MLGNCRPQDNFKAALSYANKGFHVFPVHGIRPDGRCTCNQTGGCSPGKHPIPLNGFKAATTDHTQISQWWERFPDANIGVATGPASGLFVVDLDGEDGVREFEAIFGQIEAPTVATGGKGKHLWFSYPRGVDLRNGAKLHGIPVDVRGDGGYVVAPPSKHISGGAYQWIKGLADLPDIPKDLIDWILSSKDRKIQSTVLTQTNLRDSRTLEAAPGVCEGQRHGKLLEYVGRDLATGESVNNVLRRAYEWAGRCSPPMDADEVERVVNDLNRSETLKREAKTARITPICFTDFQRDNPTLKPPLIEGLLRRGEVAGIHAKSKVGKSWLGYQISLSVASGYYLFGKFRCHRGRVLILDNELHAETLAYRLPKSARAMNLNDDDWQDHVDIISLRGRLTDILSLERTMAAIPRGQYSLIVLDALYRMLPDGISENDNAAMAAVFNAIDRYAGTLDASIAFIHHATKGIQGDRDVVDVGSGAGSIARAPDSHIVLREHSEPGHVVLDAAVRSWPRIEPIGLRIDHPLLVAVDDLDCSLLKGTRHGKTAADVNADLDSKRQAIIEYLTRTGPSTKSRIRDNAGKTKTETLLTAMVDDGIIEECKVATGNNGRMCAGYRLTTDDSATDSATRISSESVTDSP